MKSKKLLFVLPFLAVSAMLTSCAGNPYNGNYTEVTDKEAVTEKLNSLAEAEKEAETGYESLVSGSLSLSYGSSEESYKAECSFTSNGIVDYSGETNTSYQKLDLNANIKGSEAGSIKMSMEMWLLDTTYLNYNFEAKSKDGNISSNGKYKGNYADSVIPAEVSSYLSMIQSMDTEIDLSSVQEILSEDGVKVYADGENKYKFEYNTNDVAMTLYLLVNNNNTYQMKLEVPEAKTSLLGMMDMTIGYTVEVKPTSKKVTAPADADKYIEQ